MRHAKRIANRFIQSSPEVADDPVLLKQLFSTWERLLGRGSVGRYETETTFLSLQLSLRSRRLSNPNFNFKLISALSERWPTGQPLIFIIFQ